MRMIGAITEKPSTNAGSQIAAKAARNAAQLPVRSESTRYSPVMCCGAPTCGSIRPTVGDVVAVLGVERLVEVVGMPDLGLACIADVRPREQRDRVAGDDPRQRERDERDPEQDWDEQQDAPARVEAELHPAARAVTSFGSTGSGGRGPLGRRRA